jgi:hypothetical protein
VDGGVPSKAIYPIQIKEWQLIGSARKEQSFLLVFHQASWSYRAPKGIDLIIDQ